MAYLGAAVLILLTVATCLSIVGRALVPLDIGIGPIRGIYDFTEIGVAAAVFAFLPWCQYSRGHASVDLFMPFFPAIMNRVLDVLIDVGMLIIAVIGAWRLYLGMLDKFSFGETTLIAQIPMGHAYMAGLAGAVAFALIAAFCVLRSIKALVTRSGHEADR
jgi:TRAP-type C4-dicarboxylate transport system permease small subunit